MMEAKISTFAGLVTGTVAQIITANLFTAIMVAAATGSAAYIGQQITKWIHYKIKNRK